MPSFDFKKIDIPGGPGTDGFVYISVAGIDAAGLAVGNFGDTDGDWHGFTVSPSTSFKQLDPPQSSNNTDIVGITPSGEIYGVYTDWSNQQHGFVVNNGVIATVDVPFLFSSGTTISGISSTGAIFGSYYDNIGTPSLHGFIDNNGTFTDFVVPGASYTTVDGITASGQIFGSSSAGAFIDNGGTFTFLSYPGALSTSIAAITSSGEIVGTYEDSSTNEQTFIDNNGVFSTVNVPGATATYLGGVTASGEIVGSYSDSSFNIHGFVDLNGAITTVNLPGATQTDIAGITPSGEIYGFYNDNLGQHAFVGIPGPMVTASNVTATHNEVFAVSSLFNVTDPDGGTITEYALRDAGSGGAELIVNGVVQPSNQEIDLTPAQLAQTTYQSGSGPDVISVKAFDGTQWSDWTSFTVTGPVDTGPVETVSNLSALQGAILPGASLFTYSDPFGSPAVQYEVYNEGTGGGTFLLNGIPLPANHDDIITAAQLSQLTYQAGAGTDTLWIKANDGNVWGPWSNAFTVTGQADTGPVETVSNLTASHNQIFPGASLFTYSDPFGKPATQYDVWNNGTGGGYFTLNGTPLAANQDNFITAAQLSQLTYHSGAGSDTLWIKANDGIVWGAWSNAFTVTGPVDTGPVETVSNITATHGQSFAGNTLFVYSDPFGSPAVQYDVWNSGTGGGHFMLNGNALPVNQDNFLTAAQFSQLTYQSGSGADTLWVKANDGIVWGAWSKAFTVTGPVDTGPVETVSNITATHGQSFAGNTLFVYSDPFGSPATQYDVWNSGTGGGYFLLNGNALPVNQDNVITAGQLSQLTYQSGSGADKLWIKANDGTVWGGWSNGFTVTAPVDNGPTVTPTHAAIVSTQGQMFAATGLFTYSDPFGSAATQYDVWNSGSGGGHFLLNGNALPTNHDDIITAGQLSQLTYEVGSGSDTLWIKANDGTAWGAWSQSFTISDPTTVADGQTLELPSAFQGELGFAGPSGTLQLDQASTFNGTVSGFGQQERIDLGDIAFGSDTTVAYHADGTGTGTGGTLSVADGQHSASITLLGQYTAASFALAGDGHGGTFVTPADSQPVDLHAHA